MSFPRLLQVFPGAHEEIVEWGTSAVGSPPGFAVVRRAVEPVTFVVPELGFDVSVEFAVGLFPQGWNRVCRP
ncbi:MAG: hypothetical protein C4K47_05280 [Candidatus Thorarchaeota archaeon]|nr:MAG: hypothetical protein C4K47_05280 [Candidatus Thorarchaeota archaeon]